MTVTKIEEVKLLIEAKIIHTKAITNCHLNSLNSIFNNLDIVPFFALPWLDILRGIIHHLHFYFEYNKLLDRLDLI